jgi:hypothetical protein
MANEGQGEGLPEVPASPEAAPEVVETASTAEAAISAETTPEETKPPKTLTQEEVDEIVAKRLAKAQRKWQREADQRIAEAVSKASPREAPQPSSRPDPSQFKTTEEYFEAVADWKADQKFSQRLTELEARNQQRQVRAQQEQTLQAFREREEAARDKYDDFDSVAYNPDLPITEAMAATIQESDSGCDLAYFLGKNPQEAARIAKLSPFLQAKELGKLEAKLASAPAPKKPSGAPAPISPVKPAGSNGFLDTTDPKSLEKLGTSAWIEAERDRQRRAYEARNR